MTDRDQTPESDQLLEAKRQAAVRAVERLLTSCQKYERPSWLSKYIDVLDCLRCGRLQDAIFAERRLKNASGSEYGGPEWVLSRELAEDVRKAVGMIRTHIHYGDKRAPLNIPGEAVDVGAAGTMEQEGQRTLDLLATSIRRDPIDDDPQFEGVLAEVEEATREALKDHPMRGGFGFCHVCWEAKKAILKERYGIDWKTPAELNPTVIFD